MAKVLIFANDETTILHFRMEIVASLVHSGHRVTVCYPLGKNTKSLEQLGCSVINVPVSRHGTSILQDVKFALNCISVIKSVKPDIVLTYTVKPNIYSSIACQVTGTPYVNNVTGLGSVLQSEGLLSKIILFLQKFAYRKSSCVFFQNSSNYQALLGAGVVKVNTPVKVIPGSGVNLEKQCYEPFPEDDGKVKFVIVSRIRADKGYGEFLEAAKVLKRKYPSTEYHVIGWSEDDVLTSKVNELSDSGVIIYHGQKTQAEVHDIVKCCNCVVLPSYHEGMANVLLEAAATGRLVVATNIPGCRETFDEGESGFGCELKDTDSLIEAMEKVIKLSYAEQVEMGKRGRKKVEREFDRQFVASAYLETIKQIVGE